MYLFQAMSNSFNDFISNELFMSTVKHNDSGRTISEFYELTFEPYSLA